MRAGRGWAGTARAALLFAVLGVLLAGCTQGTVPEGWITQDLNGLRVAHPEDWQPRGDAERVFPDAQLEVAGPGGGLPLAPLLAAYADEGALTDVELRQAMIAQRLEGELGAQFVQVRELDLGGGVGGRVLEYTFDAETPEGGQPVPSRQFEVILSAEDGRTWDLVLGGPTEALGQPVVDGVLGSLAVDE